ncbi:hypothetical protein [Cryobacterium sp. TMT1-66-1]|uniref:hypothetical protein n=1 Tax=Cryobacterium sp. TMT1-66-1 TaxID=1259242 RepID=UPI00351A0208
MLFAARSRARGSIDLVAIKRERIVDSVNKRRAAGKDLGGRRRQRFTESQILNAQRLVNASESATQVAQDLACRVPRFIDGFQNSASEE